MKSDEEKAEEIVKKRRLAAKGLKVREDGEPVDPLEDMNSLDPDDKQASVDPMDPPETNKAVAGGLGRVR